MENSCLKKYKPSSKKWILASRCAGLRRNSALIPANAGLFHYAGNNPVRYIDPDGRLTRDDETQTAVDKLGTGDKSSVSENMIKTLVKQDMRYIGNDSEAVKQANEDVKALAADNTTMVESLPIDKTVAETVTRDKDLTVQLREGKNTYSNRVLGAKPSTVQERNSDRTVNETKNKKCAIRIYYASSIDPSTGKVSPKTYKTFVDVNDDGYIDFEADGFRSIR